MRLRIRRMPRGHKSEILLNVALPFLRGDQSDRDGRPCCTSVDAIFRYNRGGREAVAMPRLIEPKTDVLDEAGYAYSFDRQMYINRKAKKAFSVEFVQDHSEDQIRKSIREHTDVLGWRFYFNAPPSEAVRHELESVLG
jgi:hypothetical protein